MQEPHFEAGWQ